MTSLSWIPSEAVTGSLRVAFDAGFTHYDDPPPAQIDDLEALRAADRFRFGNVLRAWIDADDAGQVTGSGYNGGGLIGDTTIRLGALRHVFQNALLPDGNRNTATAGSGSPRPSAVGRACLHRAGSGTGHTSNGKRRWSGRR